jgi:dolichyl-phosphate-mannose--protein O-mannosyl transferase
VFDEYHFGRFTNQYTAGTFLFDIHPPLGKLVLYFVGRLFSACSGKKGFALSQFLTPLRPPPLADYDHTVCSYANIQDVYAKDCKYIVLRCTAAFFGTITGASQVYRRRAAPSLTPPPQRPSST